jgi:hypothetical protein
MQTFQKESQKQHEDKIRENSEIQHKLDDQITSLNNFVKQLALVLKSQESQSSVSETLQTFVNDNSDKFETIKQQELDLKQLQESVKELKEEKKILA